MPTAVRKPRTERAEDRGSGARAARPLVENVAALEPGELDWDMLEPQGFYADHGRRLLEAALLALLVPLLLGFALPVALGNLLVFRDPRRILYMQPRVGRRGRVFRIFKFRTMSEPAVDAFSSWKSGGDRLRVTRLGRFLRNTHLDELPQVLNVLRGEMSLIGPRPEMVEVEAWAARAIPGFSTRLAVRPGISGLAQVTQGYTGQDVAAYAEKLRLNDRYRRELCLSLDLEILARTILWVVRGRGWGFSRSGAAAAAGPRAAQEPASTAPSFGCAASAAKSGSERKAASSAGDSHADSRASAA